MSIYDVYMIMCLLCTLTLFLLVMNETDLGNEENEDTHRSGTCHFLDPNMTRLHTLGHTALKHQVIISRYTFLYFKRTKGKV